MSIDPHELDDAQLNRELDEQVAGLSPEDLERMSAAEPTIPVADSRGRIRGRILSITGPDVFVDIGAKSEGIVPLDEFEPDELGITALFGGESGTGKTMAAEVMANDLRLNLYRIDLSAVVSKYIGETEKNLRRLFDAAENGGAILFFDEADALFGKRSEVKDSHDRYANIEINYLLQRMEEYRGLAILATNRKSALDHAFMRRLRFVVNFPFPGPRERAVIWAKVFPSQRPRFSSRSEARVLGRTMPRWRRAMRPAACWLRIRSLLYMAASSTSAIC